MRVAIIGAGVSGLACALELERLGVRPDVYEQRHRSGELFSHSAVLLRIMGRPVMDPVKDLQENFHINIKPFNKLRKIVMSTARASGTVCGDLGYFVLLGQAEDSVSNQLLSQLKAPVRFNIRADYTRLAREYDYVVAATAMSDIAQSFGCWKAVNSNWVIGATVLGSFDPNAMKMWVNTEYSKSGYAYLTPFNSKSASLVLIVSGIERKDVGDYWKKFWQIEGFDYKVANLWDLQHTAGFVYPHQAGNILMVGNAGGFLEPFLGFALVASIKSGVYAARSIVEGRSYEEYLEQLKENTRASIALRHYLDRYENKNFDRLVALVTTPGIKQLIYNTNLDVLKYTSLLVGAIEKVQSITKRKLETSNTDRDKLN